MHTLRSRPRNYTSIPAYGVHVGVAVPWEFFSGLIDLFIYQMAVRGRYIRAWYCALIININV